MKKKTLLAAALVAAVLIGSVAASWGPFQGWLARHWQRQLDSATDARADVLLGRIADLGDRGLPALVRTLDSPRTSVADGARRALREKLLQWKSLHARDASPRLARLAEALAGAIDDLGPSARGDAAELAARILRRPLDARVVERVDVIAACEKVLAAAARDRGSPANRSLAAASDTSERPLADVAMPIAELASLPGGDLGPKMLSDASATPNLLANNEPGNPATEPRRFRDGEAARPLGPPGPSLQLLDGSEPEPKSFVVVPLAARSIETPSDQPESVAETRPSSPPTAVASSDPGARSAETIDLIRRLRDEVPASVAAARAELQRRGFTNVQLELGRQLSDPDPEVRKRLVRILPSLPGVDAEPWMLWLARDPDPEVRLAAITLMATGNDPTLLERVERIARSDSDSRVRRQAEQIARRQSQTPY